MYIGVGLGNAMMHVSRMCVGTLCFNLFHGVVEAFVRKLSIGSK